MTRHSKEQMKRGGGDDDDDELVSLDDDARQQPLTTTAHFTITTEQEAAMTSLEVRVRRQEKRILEQQVQFQRLFEQQAAKLREQEERYRELESFVQRRQQHLSSAAPSAVEEEDETERLLPLTKTTPDLQVVVDNKTTGQDGETAEKAAIIDPETTAALAVKPNDNEKLQYAGDNNSVSSLREESELLQLSELPSEFSSVLVSTTDVFGSQALETSRYEDDDEDCASVDSKGNKKKKKRKGLRRKVVSHLRKPLKPLINGLSMRGAFASGGGGGGRLSSFTLGRVRETFAKATSVLAKMLKDQEEEADYECGMTEDVYSLMYIAPILSTSFGYSLFICLFQLTLIVLVFIDQVTFGAENPLSIPPAVPPQVAGAQAMCMILAVAVQQDMIQAVSCFHSGHSDELTAEIPGATYPKFVLSNTLQLITGLQLLVSTFSLIMTSDTVIDVFLNFAGLEFISMIDDVGFSLGQQGFITKGVKALCDQVGEVKQPKATNYLVRKLCYLLVTTAMMVGFSLILIEQKRGVYICNRVFVQFGDNWRPEYAGFSGNYVRQSGLISDRVVYVEENSFGKKGMNSSMLAYCAQMESWTHSTFDPTRQETMDPCSDWGARSPGTVTFDITETAGGNWAVYSVSTKKILLFEDFYLKCNDCDDEPRGTCAAEHGTCVDNDCVCHPGNFGLNCLFSDACEKIQSDHRRGDAFLSTVDGYTLSDAYNLLRDEDGQVVEFYKHPVYAYDYGDDEGIDLVMFTGRRWIITDYLYLVRNSSFTANDVIYFLRNSFHAVTSQYTYAFVSDPMDVGSPSYRGTPLNFGWYRTTVPEDSQVEEVDESEAVETTFLCAVCSDETNPCHNLNECKAENGGTCECRVGYHGALCEGVHFCGADYPCANTGRCLANGECSCGTTAASSRFYGSFCELDHSENRAVAWVASSSKWHDQTRTCGCNSTRQVEYRGTLNVTKSGLPCQPWASQEPHEHSYTPINFPNAGLERNYCRNPTIDGQAFCFTQDRKKRREACRVPVCWDMFCPALEDTCGCQKKQQRDYRGTINVTRTGRPCDRWQDHESMQMRLEDHPELQENYCRNVDGLSTEGRPFCYTTTESGVQVETCNVPFCPNDLCS